ncbi:conserved exported hypothetical protein [Bosea sp. 62]|uniref:hypothetical protein n=1 Tax=unclassified Bosea (in: a-proteobacteria) TaxID=2653178 RepID=UPI0012551797|nr:MULTISPECIES: hypothetical protein [unclassified Bosea (in: a-proteobacteria)]CAD5265913.1 conserved exported hypothetical protein [Bosea sp. 46]CAD5267886.1 conserved exported hypothetical protein [Bosea sp. 21B]CAD5271059.1 conserved exported hypothetical protein [Bosea sp. 7B]VVT55539.1 conserved exported hypothetical protein [Bosea sp. EC-HK365B]VXB88568.1 conserved exported hypothetical protein [Bosea sp. 29B]
MSTISKQIIAAAALTAAAMALASPASAAGFWETLFGVPQRPTYAPVPDNPLHMTVRPKRKKATAKLDGATKDVKDGPKTPLVKPMEYANDPFWYLRDETLKKGDIVVLKDRVVVFDGGARAYANFASFQTSRLLSAKAKSQLKYLVSTPRDNHTVWEPVQSISDRNTSASAELSERTR